MKRRQSPSLYRGEREIDRECKCVTLPYGEEADSFSMQRRERLLYTEERVSICYIHRGESAPLLYVQEADSFSRHRKESVLSVQSRECPSDMCR